MPYFVSFSKFKNLAFFEEVCNRDKNSKDDEYSRLKIFFVELLYVVTPKRVEFEWKNDDPVDIFELQKKAWNFLKYSAPSTIHFQFCFVSARQLEIS